MRLSVDFHPDGTTSFDMEYDERDHQGVISQGFAQFTFMAQRMLNQAPINNHTEDTGEYRTDAGLSSALGQGSRSGTDSAVRG
jgi:hypothetical protein